MRRHVGHMENQGTPFSLQSVEISCLGAATLAQWLRSLYLGRANSDFEESGIVLTYGQVLKWRHVKRGVAKIRVPRALAREAS